MPGRMGGKRRTAQNLEVVKVDTALDLIFVKGCLPGFDGTHVLVRDSKKMTFAAHANQVKGLDAKILPKGVDDLPFPAGTKALAEMLPEVIIAPSKRVTDPFAASE